MLLALDTDIIIYKSILTTEQEIDWGDDVWTLYTDLKEAQKVFKKQLETIQLRLKSDEILCCLTDAKDNFRKHISPSYKSNRKGTRKPVGYVALVEWVRDTYPSLSKPSLEADDVLGIIATKPENKGKVIVVSDDKDLKTVPGKLYRPMQDEALDITEADADAFFLQQCLQGDAVDGYGGLKGVGEKTAKKILGIRPVWDSVEQAYIKAGYTRDDALEQARLARILRWTDWDEKKGEPILWTPQNT